MSDFDERIEKIRKNIKESSNIIEPEIKEEKHKASRAGSEFLASVLAGALIGYGIDWCFDIQPWGMMSFIIMGFISAVMRANATMKAENKEESKKNDK